MTKPYGEAADVEAINRSKASVARAVRILTKLGYFDPTCHVSVRTSGALAISPQFDATCPSPVTLASDDVAFVTTEAAQGSGPVPSRFAEWHAAIYRKRRDVGAIAMVAPPQAMAFANAGVRLKALTHAEAWIVGVAGPVLDPDQLIDDIDALSRISSEFQIAHIRGLYTIVLGSNIERVMALCHSYEYLAKMNSLVGSLSDRPREVSPGEIAAIQADRATPETVSSVDPFAYMDSFDPGPRSERAEDESGISEKVALSCRILAAQKTLVGFYEHVSHRLPTGDSFAMSPAKNFALTTSEDIITVGLDEDATWIAGDHAPAPFRRFHRDIFLARPDVNAVVHTHELYGRAFVMSGVELEPISPIGAEFAGPPPMTARACMVFSEDDRMEAVAALGAGGIVHAFAHGTDYVAGTIEEATVAAIHREHAYRTYQQALVLGNPEPLSTDTLGFLRGRLPASDTWWRFYASMVD